MAVAIIAVMAELAGLCRQLRAMLVSVIELRASNWGRNETDRTVGAGDSMNGRSAVTSWRVTVETLLISNY